MRPFKKPKTKIPDFVKVQMSFQNDGIADLVQAMYELHIPMQSFYGCFNNEPCDIAANLPRPGAPFSGVTCFENSIRCYNSDESDSWASNGSGSESLF